MQIFSFFKIQKKISRALVLTWLALWTLPIVGGTCDSVLASSDPAPTISNPKLIGGVFDPFQPSSDPVPPLKSDSTLIRVLVIEGGGIRGVLSAKILEEIERRAQCPIIDLFDVMVGSSTGSIQVALLTTPLPHSRQPAYTAKDIVHFYDLYGKEILTPSLWRRIWTLDGFIAPLLSHKNLIREMDKLIGDRKFNQALLPVFIPSYDLNTTDIILLSSLDSINGQKPLKDVVLASTSIPNIFPSFPWPFADGIHYLTDALFAANDPVQSALIYTDQLYPNNPKLLLSLGSGFITTQTPPRASRHQGLIHALPIWMRMVFSGNADKLNALMEEIKRRKGFGLEFYFRLNPRILDSEANHFDGSRRNIQMLEQSSENYIREHSDEIDRIIEILKTHK